MTEREALMLALKAMKQIDEVTPTAMAKLIIPEIEQALAQPEQKPVAWLYIEPENPYLNVHYDDVDVSQFPYDEWFPVYKSTLQRTWVNMTADEVDQGLLKTNYVMKTAEAWRHGVEWAQFNLMRKNT